MNDKADYTHSNCKFVEKIKRVRELHSILSILIIAIIHTYSLCFYIHIEAAVFFPHFIIIQSLHVQ